MMSHYNSNSQSAADFIGCCVSFEVIGGMGYFQGTVIDIDNSNQELKLTKVIHDGRPANVKEMTFSAHQIAGLEVLSKPELIMSTSAASGNRSSQQRAVSRPVALSSSPLDYLTSNLLHHTLNGESAMNISKISLQHVEKNDQPDAIQDFLSRTQSSACLIPQTKNSLACTKSLPPITQEAKQETKGACGPLLEQADNLKKANKKLNEREFQVSTKTRSNQQASTADIVSRNLNRPMLPQHQPLAATTKSNGNYGSTGKSGSPYHSRSTGGYYGGPGYGEAQQQSGGRGRKGEQQRQKNISTFGLMIHDEDISEDFDFESNNKLFDKQAVAKEIDQMKQEQLHQQPDVISQTDHRHRPPVIQQDPSNGDQRHQSSEYQPEAKYRYDQNVLEGSKDVGQKISLPPDEPAELMYATDSGFLVPCVSLQLRQSLLSNAKQIGFSLTRQHEITARAAAELCMQLLGGDHRLNSKNSHQVPRVVVLCGSHQQGSLGLNTARQLHTHELHTTALTPTGVSASLPFTHELNLFQLTGGEVAHSTAQLDASTAIDLILDARLDHNGCPGNHSGKCSEWASDVTTWARRQRCPVLALDPPGHEHALTSRMGLPARALVVPVLPLAYAEQQGIVHLVKLALPKKLFQDIGITYCSPFQAKFMVTLHPCE